MVIIHRVKPVGRLLPTDGSFVAFIAEQDETIVGHALAASNPREIAVIHLEGDPAVCRLLLGRLVGAAGERNLSGWFPVACTDVLEEWGFSRGTQHERPTIFYSWNRNADVED